MPTATYQKFQNYVKDKNHGVHNHSTGQHVVALVAAANAPNLATNTVLADLTQVSYTFCSTRNVTLSSSDQTGGTYDLVLTDLTLSASGGAVGPFRYVVLYNDTPTSPADPLICMFDYGADQTLNDGESLVIDFAANAGTTGSLFTET